MDSEERRRSFWSGLGIAVGILVTCAIVLALLCR